MDDSRGQEEYTRQVAEAYCKTPGTTGTVRRADRMGTAQLYQRGVAVSGIENAFVLAAARRPSQVRRSREGQGRDDCRSALALASSGNTPPGESSEREAAEPDSAGVVQNHRGYDVYRKNSPAFSLVTRVSPVSIRAATG